MKKLIPTIACVLLSVTLAWGAVVYNRINKDIATGGAALSVTVAPGCPWRLDSMRIKLASAGLSGTLTLTMNAIAGGTYDVLLLSQAMIAVTDLVWFPERDLIFTSGDELIVAWANANTITYGIEVYYTKLDN